MSMHGVERAREAFQRLLRQAVDQVDVDRAEAVRAAGIDHRARFLDALDAVDRRLHRADRNPARRGWRG